MSGILIFDGGIRPCQGTKGNNWELENMRTKPQSSGFTLVELAIVMTIIGLLIGGILKGQELMENARVTSTIAQTKSYEAAVTTFRDTYSAWPGDIQNAQARIPNCTGGGGQDMCQNAAPAASLGNSIIGPTDGLNQGGFAVTDERIQFWVHMSRADLIAGVSGTGTAIIVGEAFPSAKIGGGFSVGHHSGPGVPLPGIVAGINAEPSGIYLALRSDFSGALTTGAGLGTLSGARAAQIDRKMDDGQSTTGFVRGQGAGGNCSAAAAAATPGGYNETSTSKDCNLLFRIQG